MDVICIFLEILSPKLPQPGPKEIALMIMEAILSTTACNIILTFKENNSSKPKISLNLDVALRLFPPSNFSCSDLQKL